MRSPEEMSHVTIGFQKANLGFADTETIRREKIDQTLELKHPAWLDDVIVIKKTPEQNIRKN